jgi:hypothetical protein
LPTIYVVKRENIWIWLTLGLVLIILAGSVGYVFWKNRAPKTESKASPYEFSQNAISNDSSNVLSVNDGVGIPLGTGGNMLGLQTDIGSNTSSNSNSPGSMKEYEKYKNEKNALIGEIEVGTGPVADKGKKVALLYRGWLTNGTLIDESKPQQAGGKIVHLLFILGEGQVIAGIEQGVFGMKEGGKRRIVIPPTVGYGDRGYSSIPANSVLVFDVELVSVQ